VRTWSAAVVLVQPSLFGKVLSVAPILNLPHAVGGDQQQSQHAGHGQFQRRGTHGTSLKKT
jgi:hypothetical protein